MFFINTMIDLYTDGSCLGNPGPGGWAAIIVVGGQQSSISGGCIDTTNNRMELEAATRGIEYIYEMFGKKEINQGINLEINLYTDSRYVLNRSGLFKIRRNPGCIIKNKDLWINLDRVLLSNGSGVIHWNWVKGHSGHPQNTLADKLAKSAAQMLKRSIAKSFG